MRHFWGDLGHADRGRGRHAAGRALRATSVALVLGLLAPVAASAATGAITGTVTGPGAVPAAHVLVTAYDSGQNVRGAVYTADNGTYALSGLPPGPYTIAFEPDEDTGLLGSLYDGARWWEDATPVVVTGGTIRANVNAQLARGGTIGGTVRGPDAQPLAGVRVYAVGEDDDDDRVSAVTGSDGTYVMQGLRPATYRVLFVPAEDSGLLVQWSRGQTGYDTANPIAVGDGASITGIDATLTRGVSISGTVTDDDGRPLAGVEVYADPRGQDADDGGFAVTDAAGRYTIRGLASGTYVVSFFADDERLAPQAWKDSPTWDDATPITLAASAAVTGIDARLHPAGPLPSATGHITGRVTDDDGAPVGGATVAAIDPDDVLSTQTTTTGADGTYDLMVPEGRYRVRFAKAGPYSVDDYRAQGGLETATSLDVWAGQTVSGIDGHLERRGTGAGPAGLAGRAVDVTSGNGVPGVSVLLQPATVAGPDLNGAWTLVATTGDDGTFVGSVGPNEGRYFVAFVHEQTQTLYHRPGAAVGERASPVHLRTGETVAGLDAVLTTSRAVVVPPPGPVASPAAKLRSTRITVRGKVARASLSCPARTETCAGTLALLRKRGGAGVTYGRATYAIRAGRSATVAVTLGKAGRTALAKRRGTLTVRARILPKNGTALAARTVTLRTEKRNAKR